MSYLPTDAAALALQRWSVELSAARDDSAALALGIFDLAGNPLYLNRGMGEALGGELPDRSRHLYLVNPSFDELLEPADDGLVFCGWLTAGDGFQISRTLRAQVFRKGGDVTFLVEELKAVFDPRGGYWQPGGKFMPSIIAELGYVIEKHLQTIGLIRKVELDEHQKKLVDEKRAEFEARNKQTDAFAKSVFPEGAQLCPKCSTAAVVMMDGCMTCLNCGDSKCG
jgi:hypothetical protein